MAIRDFIRLPEPGLARGDDPALAFRSQGAEGLALELQDALRHSQLFERWRAKQDEPDDVDISFAATDPQALVRGEQNDLAIDLVVITSLAGAVFKHRLRLLAGAHWQLRDVTAV